MKHCRYLLLLLALLVSAGLRAQYNPNNPDEPGTKPWLLTLKSIPADAGSFNISKQTSHAAGEQIGLKANDNGNYKFADWEDEEGNIIATTAQYNYTMPAKHVTLVARYTYSPNNPNEPDSPTQHQYSRIYLETSPADGGSFNVSSGNSYEVGTIVTLHAYNNANFKFEKWTEDGQTISTDNELEYTVKATDSHLTAHFNYSPGNPGEPSEASISHHLYLKANPSEGGYFNMSSDNSFVAGEVVYLSAYSSSYYQFRNWTQDGEIVSTSASFVYIMPDKNTTLVANYDYIYSPDNPNEPGQSQTERYYIYGMRENVLAGQTINYPVYLENTGQTTGLSIDLNFPLGFTVDATNASLTARTNSHTLEVKDLGNNNFRFLVRGAENIQGVNGKVMEIPVSVPDTVTVGNVFTIELSKGAIYKPDGSQAIVTVRNGSIKILRAAGDIPDSPDYVVSNIQTTSSTVMPQDFIHLSWQVKNEGNLVGYGGWSERIYLVSESGKKVCIGTTYYDTNVLDPGATVSRSTDMALAKLIGIEGAARICITIIPSVSSGEIIEYQSNNSAETENAPLHVGKRLYLTMPESALAEGEHSTVRCQLSRSGNWTSSEDYELSLLSGDNRLTVPETVTIPREQSAAYFYLTINDNNASDADSVFTLQVSGNGYEAVEGVLVISDDEQPSLQVRVSKSEVTEGETFQLTITAERPSDGPIPLIITAEQPRRFVLPTKVEIPANETSVTVDVTAVDNDEIELQESIAIRVSSPGHGESECVILLNDNDMPTLSLTLTPDAVSEDGGPLALFGMIKRTDNLDKRVIMKLSDDSNGLLSYTTNTIVLERNKQNVQFNIGVVDNETVDGDHTVTVKAEVYATSCDCSIPSNGAGSLTATVTIIDNDGPTLKIKPEGTAILEGSEGNVFVVSHNAPTTKDVKVRISSDKDDILEYDHELTIPVGSSSANLLVNVKSNDISDDSNIVTFKVEADDFAVGSCWLLITDQTLPDAVVSIRADKEEAKAEETVGLSIVVKNVGNSTLRSSTPIQFAFSGQKNTTKLTIGKAVEPGDSVVIDYNYYLPAMVGEYYFEATVNADGRVPELLLANNTSEKAFITLLPRFSATAKAEKEQYKQGETIVISGTASGEEGKNAKVEVYLMNDGARLTLDATTDETGNYSMTWEPMNNLSGHFDIGACYPGSNLKESMNAIDIIGISASGSYDICQITLGEIYTGKLVIKNPGIVNQTQLSVEQKAQSDNCVLTFSTPNAINAGESVEIGYTINSSALSQGSSWQQMPIEITTAEGAKLEYLLYYFVYAQKAVLESNTKYIQTTMTLGTPREYPIVIRNIGKAETGKITLALPSWIQTATPVEMASLEQGDSTTIILRFMPTDRMKLNTKVTGRFGVNCDNGDGLAVGFEITPVSDAKGTLTIDVVDEFTFYTDESPHVEEANVQVMNPATYEIVTQGKTNKDGTFTAELKEGYYSITVEAEKHQTYTSCLIVDPGIIKTEEVFLPYDAVTYDYNVTETEVNDEYEIETIAKFETRVPKPVLTMTLPEDAPLPNSIFPVVITNHGLINAVDVNFSLTVSGGYSLEFLNATSLDSLAPQSSYILYAKLKPNNKEEASSRMKEISETEYCLDIWGYGSFVNLCNKYTNEEIFKAYSKWGYCGLNHYFDFWNELAQYLHLRPSSPTDNEPSDVNPWDFFNDIINFVKICDKNKPDNEDYDISDDDIPQNDNCNDKPTLSYKLITVDGKRKEMNGVAADGVSQIMIVLDPNESIIPSDDCEWTCHWTLKDDDGRIGTLENTESWSEVIYTAPEDYPNEYGSEMTLTARNDVYKDGVWKFYKEQTVILTRVPVVFLHGVNGHNDVWEKCIEKLIRDKRIYEEWQIVNHEYGFTNNAKFNINYKQAGLGKVKCDRNYNDNKIVFKKMDLIGYSMGGVLARFYIQEYRRKDDVHKLITVDTPHSGSELGDFVQVYPICKSVAEHLGYKPLDALHDMAVTSDATRRQLNGLDKISNIKVPVHSIVATTNDIQYLNNCKQLEAMSALISATPYLFYRAMEIVGVAYDFTRCLMPGDLCVSLDSQIGGLEPPYYSKYSGLNHVNCAKSSDVIERIADLLVGASSNNSLFSKSWFKPEMRFYPPLYARSLANEIVIEKSLPIPIDAIIDGDTLQIDVTQTSNLESCLIIASFGETYQYSNEMLFRCPIPSAFSGDIKIYALGRTSEDIIFEDSTFINVPYPRAYPVSITSNDIVLIKDIPSSVQVRCLWSDGSTTYVRPNKIAVENKLAAYNNDELIGMKVGTGTLTLSYMGISCSANLIVISDFGEKGSNDDEDSDDSPSICSTVTLSFKQKNVMARQAFRGTLTVNNGHENEELKDIKVYLEVRNEEGKLATQREFQIDAESLDGFDGKLAMDAGWTLAADSKGTATILFIPSKYAAPTEPKDYSFGGSFSYTDPSTGLTVTRQLNPVTLTVNPSPNLEMTYFMQRDVFGDDALTEEIEPMIPSEFALLVNNKGYGDAKNMNLTTRQPQIIDNQKGLAIDFELISTQLNGGEKTLSMGNSMASDFGDIPAHSQAYAQWWLQSSLMGHFIEYDVKANHLTSRDNPYLSLIDTVTIHELIHGFTVRTDTETPVRGFLVNDIADAEDLPDEVYFSDATQKSVSKVGYASITKRSDTEFLLNVRPSAMGWNYGSLADPANGKQRLVSVTRLSDNAAIATDNVWQTPCTLRDGKDPVHENRLHFVFELQEEGETYLLSFEQRPDVELQVERFKGGPGENEILEQQLKEISVLFNKPIDASTFTYDDITLTCQGVKQDVSKIGISSISSTEYKLILEPLTNKNGYFVLTVYTDDIIDSEGYTGFEGKQYAWMQIVDGSNIEDITSSEELTIKVSPLPVSDRMFLNGNFRRIRKLIVYDVNGVQKMLLEDIAPNEAIDASTLPSGVYLLTIQTEIGTRRIKIIKV